MIDTGPNVYGMYSVAYRLAREEDIPSISMVFAEAGDDSDRKRGFFESPTNHVQATMMGSSNVWFED